MRPIAILILLLALVPAGSRAQPVGSLERAFDAMRAQDWAAATRAGAEAGPIGAAIIEWHRLRAKEGSFADAQTFLARYPDWPGLPYLRQRSEHAIPARADSADVRAFFADQSPRTGHGALRFADALERSGLGEAARQERVRAWATLSLTTDEEAEFVAAHAPIIAPHHWTRTDMLLWRGLTGEARRMLPRLDAGERALAEARIALRDGDDGVNALIDAVPAALAGDPGLAYERFLWRVTRGRTDSAIDLLEAQRDLGRPEAWGNLRRRYARQLMRADDNRRAYAIASAHGLSEGRHYADLEWLSGYIALRKLRDADRALAHFERFERAVDTPISLSRAQYWQARAHASVGNDEMARADYIRAAQHQTAFYGQLAAEAADLPTDPNLTGRETFADWRGAPFLDSTVFEAAILLLRAGELSLGERFLTHLTETLPRPQIGQLAALARDMGEPHLEVMIAKRAVQYGSVLEGPYFPLHPLAENTGAIPPELALAIARRESEFDPRVVSPVGARGLMQLMPATAEEMAGDIGLGYSASRLLSDPDYNARLGLTYLAELIETFGASPVLVSVAYNAGPSRAFSWMERFGDPRRPDVDLVDWIEHIPFRETRNYVMRVTESLAPYRARLSGVAAPITLTSDLRGAYPTGAPLARPHLARPDAGFSAPATSLRPRLRPSAPATE